MTKQIFSFLTFLFISFSSFSQDDGVNYLALAQLLVKDGHFLRAEKTLNKINDMDQAERALFKSLEGIIRLSQKKYKDALNSFSEARALGLKENEIQLYIAEALLQLGEYTKAQTNLERLDGDLKEGLPYFLIKAEIHWKLKQKTQAWNVLLAAQNLKLSQNVLSKKKFNYLMQEGLFQSAKDLAFLLLKNPDNFQDVLAMASRFRVMKQYQISLTLLQALQFIKPNSDLVALELAQNYLALNQKFSAAIILEESAKYNSSLNFEAAEILRQIGKSYRARFLNLTTIDPAQRLKQKLALYLEEDDYDSLQFMIPQLNKYEMLEDQQIRYAVAYSFFRTGDFKKTQFYLNGIDKDGLFEKSVELKKEIQQCKLEKWSCSETI